MAHQSSAPTKPDATPTIEIYSALQRAYDHFNTTLFGGKLPSVLIVLQRKTKTMGYVSYQRWESGDGRTVDELAVNPEFFLGFSNLETLQTMVHEMVHIWQQHFGNPSRRCYHNHEWANKMISLGLMPSHTGRPGGRRVGQKIAEYAYSDGSFFISALRLFFSGFGLPWVDRFPQPGTGTTHLVYNRKGEVVDFTRRPDLPLVTPIGQRLSDEHLLPVKEALVYAAELSTGALRASMTAAAHPETDPLAIAVKADQEVALEQSEALQDSMGANIPIGWYQQFTSEISPAVRESPKPTRVKYSCICVNNIWGRPGLEITCNSCHTVFQAKECGSA